MGDSQKHNTRIFEHNVSDPSRDMILVSSRCINGTGKIKNSKLTSEITPVSATLIKSAKSLSAFLDKKKQLKQKKIP